MRQSKFELINLVDMPPTLLGRADEVIE